MRPAQLTPENSLAMITTPAEACDASMRPAQLTPENVKAKGRPGWEENGFNEAGAINAGKPPGAVGGDSG